MVMANGLTLEETLLTRIEHAKKKAREKEISAEEKRKSAEQDMEEAKRFLEFADNMQKSLELNRWYDQVNQNGHRLLDVEHMRTQSTWKNLREIAAVNKGVLVAIDAVTALVDAGVYRDREQARNAVYSNLNHRRAQIERIRQGVYRIHEPAKFHGQTITGRAITGNFGSIRLNNPMSFRLGVAKVLKDAHGEPLQREEIWHRMQVLGIQSTSQNPLKWVDRHAQQLNAQRIAPHVWRWRVESTMGPLQDDLFAPSTSNEGSDRKIPDSV